MRTLYVLFDAHCGLCTEISGWLREQPAYVELRTVSSVSAEAREKFSALPQGELAVISESGQVWLGNNAFLVCLWALRRYRAFARTLASPLLRPLARQAFSELSHSRGNISRLLGLKSEVEIRKHLGEVTIPPCELPSSQR
jgi:predicted DCC family thiol-disulfide oxidoreductase YuxK